MTGCPEGMYPTGTEEVTYLNEAENLAELREMVEPMLGPLNFPIGWWFSEPLDNPDWDDEVDERHFQITVWMPRKMKTWGVRTMNFDRQEVQEWLDTTVRAEVEEWYGWK